MRSARLPWIWSLRWNRSLAHNRRSRPLEGHAAQNRLRYLLARLVGAMAGPEHPLLLFIDDVQWIDSASLGLLEALLLDPEVDGLLVVGAFRDNEVDETHIFTTAQGRSSASTRPRDRDPDPRRLETSLLSPSWSRIPWAMAPKSSPAYCTSKTAGNPLFAHRLLSRMADEGHLRFDPDDRRWRWDLGAIRGLPSSDNVVDLLTLQVSSCPKRRAGCWSWAPVSAIDSTSIF